ncbi:MAG: hypothetical protein M3235_13210 [Actinomycetota bacterium]|nr:hypothetical protein [Actinomycetota bacterium]
MSKVVLGVAQVVGIVVLAFIAFGVLAGVLQVVVTVAVIAAIPLAGWWLYKNVSGARSARAVTAAGPAPDRRTELERRAVVDSAGRCGWCGSPTRHTDEHGFPTTPLRYHRAEIDAML